jgi:WD40 repeat protein
LEDYLSDAAGPGLAVLLRRLWDVKTRKEIRRFTGHTDLINSVSFSPDDRLLVSASSDRTVRWWDISTGLAVRRFPEHHEKVYCATFSPDSKWVASAGVPGWDRAEPKIVIQILIGQGLDGQLRPGQVQPLPGP